MADLAAAVATLPGVRAARAEKGEVVADADRDALLGLMTTLRDDPRFRDNAARVAHREEADALVAGWTRTLGKMECFALAKRHRRPGQPHRGAGQQRGGLLEPGGGQPARRPQDFGGAVDDR